MQIQFYDLFESSEFQSYIIGVDADLKRIMGSGVLDIVEWLDSEIEFHGGSIRLYMLDSPCIYRYFCSQSKRYSFLSMSFNDEDDNFKYAMTYNITTPWQNIMIHPFYPPFSHKSYTLYNFLNDLSQDYDGIYSALDTIL